MRAPEPAGPELFRPTGRIRILVRWLERQRALEQPQAADRRRADERVACYPLIWPSCALAEDVIVQLLRDLIFHSDKDARKSGVPNESSKSRGRRVTTPKGGIGSLPSHLTRRA